jgi:hypothetical protein
MGRVGWGWGADPSSSRRKPGSILIFAVSRKPTHIRVDSSDIPVSRLLSFACPKESNQRKRHPRGHGHARIRARVTSRAGCGVRRQYVHVLTSNSPASCRRSLRDFSSACSPRPRGAREERRARQSLPQKHRIYATPVIPAEAGIHFCSWALRENRLTSLCVSSAILAAGFFLLLAQKKVTKEKDTLAAAVCRASMPGKLREQAPGSADSTSMY